MHSPYQTLAHPREALFEEKRSRFIAHLSPASSRERAFQWLEEVKQRAPGASHYCWAYVLGDPHQPAAIAFNDDAEPSGSAGKPMANVLLQRQVGDTMAVVARFFGGTKLGKGGLVRAYAQAVSLALDLAELDIVRPATRIEIHIDFAFEEKIRNLLHQHQLTVADAHYAERVTLGVDAPLGLIEELSLRIQNLTHGQGWLKCH